MNPRHASCFLALIVTALFIASTGCGGGGNSGGGGGTPPPPPPPAQFQITTTAALPGTVGAPFSATLTAANGTPPYKWTVGGSAGVPPPGLSLTEAGVLSGSPTTAGTLVKVINVTDSSNPPKTATANVTFDIFGFSSADFIGGRVSERYQTLLETGGGKLPLHYSLKSGSLPSGLDLKQITVVNRDAMFLSGFPTQSGDFSITIHAEDSSAPARAVDVTGTIRIANGLLRFSESSLPYAVVGKAYSHQVPVTGGIPPYTWTVTRNPDLLPTGIALSSATGNISGTTDQAGFSTFTVTVNDSSSQFTSISQTFSLLTVSHELTGRNDTIATATPVYPGYYLASISPYGSNGTDTPDQDYYEMTMPGGTVLDIGVGGIGRALSTVATLQPGLEIIDQNGVRHSTCNDVIDDDPPQDAPIAKDLTPSGFDDPCMNASIFDNYSQARLTFKVPGTGNTTFYLHVFDTRGDARADAQYRLNINKN